MAGPDARPYADISASTTSRDYGVRPADEPDKPSRSTKYQVRERAKARRRRWWSSAQALSAHRLRGLPEICERSRADVVDMAHSRGWWRRG